MPATVAVPMMAPAGLVIVMVAPASPLPFTVVPSAVTAPVGAAGAVMSGAIVGTRTDTLPAPSAWVTPSVSPFNCGVVSVAL